MFDQWMERIREELAEAINNQVAHFHHDHTSSVRVLGKKVGKKGREFTGYGRTGVADITGSIDGEDMSMMFIFDCRIPWTGHWILKHFHTGTFDYREEKKDREGSYLLKIRVHLIGGKIEMLAAESLTSLDHDSVTMPVRALESSYLTNSQYLRQQLFD